MVQTRDPLNGQIFQDGIPHVIDGVKISQAYVTDLTMNNAIQYIALATGVKLGGGRIQLWNRGATTENIRWAWLEQASDPNDYLGFSTDHATTGLMVPVYADLGEFCKTDWLGVPALATHIGICNESAGDTNVVQVTQGI